MIQFTDINYIKLRNIIGKLPPGRARKKYEATLGGLLGKGPSAGIVAGIPLNDQPSTDAAPLRLKLVVTSQREVLPPIRLAPWLIVRDASRFIEATLADLAVYVAAENMGSKHWVKNLLDEKQDHLERCGVKVEIEEVQ